MEEFIKNLKSWLENPTFEQFIIAIIGIIIITLISRFLKRSVNYTLRDSDSRYYGRKLINLLRYFLIVFFVAIVFKDRLSGLTVALGVASAGIAFALQEVIASVAGWIAISFASFYKPGDRVQLGGIKGDVIDIGILRTTLMECGEWVQADLYTGRVVRIANSFVFKEPVFNYSGEFPFLWDEIQIPVKYGSDHKLARKILEATVNEVVEIPVDSAQEAWKKMVRRYLIEDAKINPMVSLKLTNSYLEFTIRYVVNYKKRRVTKDRLFTVILDKFLQTNGQVSITADTLEIFTPSPLDLRINNQPKLDYFDRQSNTPS